MDGFEQNSETQSSVLSVIKSIFEDFNLVALSEDVYNHVLDIISTYTGEILVDAKFNALYAGRPHIAEQDLDLAVENKLENVILSPLHKEQLLEYAEKINSQALPLIKSGPGIKLAPEKYTITAPNYCIVSNASTSTNFANVPSRIVLPSSNSGAGPGSLAVYRVSNAPGGNPQGQRGTNSGTLSDIPGSGVHVIAPANASASLIRVQPSTFSQSGHPLVCSTTPNSTSSSESFCICSYNASQHFGTGNCLTEVQMYRSIRGNTELIRNKTKQCEYDIYVERAEHNRCEFNKEIEMEAKMQMQIVNGVYVKGECGLGPDGEVSSVSIENATPS
ncbi:unnamed protein product [Hydatigera taeniaeformis]|uniref:Transcription initiation factor TFIID subunit 9 n=1 Tax=Hydatigena taeniaeformis TaxID=6205 RepID=A0A0R3WHZ0_HYDTA|nr:unnamed protein product [Hydatigera taeniaeformis]